MREERQNRQGVVASDDYLVASDDGGSRLRRLGVVASGDTSVLSEQGCSPHGLLTCSTCVERDEEEEDDGSSKFDALELTGSDGNEKDGSEGRDYRAAAYHLIALYDANPDAALTAWSNRLAAEGWSTFDLRRAMKLIEVA